MNTTIDAVSRWRGIPTPLGVRRPPRACRPSRPTPSLGNGPPTPTRPLSAHRHPPVAPRAPRTPPARPRPTSDAMRRKPTASLYPPTPGLDNCALLSHSEVLNYGWFGLFGVCVRCFCVVCSQGLLSVGCGCALLVARVL